MSATTELTEEKVLEALRGVKFPGLSRDIVSFGFIKDLTVGGGNVSFRLEIIIRPAQVGGPDTVAIDSEGVEEH